MTTLTRDIVYAAAFDAGNRSMRKAGRIVWSEEDFDAAAEAFARLWPADEESK